MVITFLFLLLFGRFYYVQVAWSGTLTGKALDQWTREIPIIAERGLITDRNGTVLADNTTKYTVFARTNAIEDKVKTSAVLSSVLGLDEKTLYEKLTSVRASELTVARRIGKEQAEKLSENDLAGVYYSRDNERVYPKNELLCQVLGFTSSDNSGTTGIEKYYDTYLRGKDGELLYETDLVGIDLKGAVAGYKEAESGYNVQLTVDAEIQTVCESALKKAYENSHPKNAECIVLDVNTFEILAFASLPSYNLNEIPRNDLKTLNAYSRSGIISDVYEPGSTFKVITSAINLEEWNKGNPSAFSPTHVFSSSRTRKVDGTTVKCWNAHKDGRHSNQTLWEALNNSCNPCFTDIALSLGKETFYEYLSLLGFGQRTGVDFTGEAFGLLLNESIVRNCDLARIGFGQTIAVTGIQLASAVASVVNGGYYYTPHFLKRVYAGDGYELKKIEPTLKNRTVSEKTSSLLCQMLEGVVKDGSGKKAYIDGYRIAGKTGTAQKYEDGRIAQGKYVSSFVGFFPANQPKYLALVIVDEPQGAYYGSVVAAPIAKEIFEGIIDLKKIKPSL